jgi:hypothetical protein
LRAAPSRCLRGDEAAAVRRALAPLAGCARRGEWVSGKRDSLFCRMLFDALGLSNHDFTRIEAVAGGPHGAKRDSGGCDDDPGLRFAPSGLRLLR